ncbi:MAG: DUF1990 family protein [Pseudonocardia sp.]
MHVVHGSSFTRRVRVGRGPAAFASTSALLSGWDMHRRAGVGVLPAGVEQRAGATVLLRWGRWPLRIVAPCRVTAVTRTQRRAGFAYATLPGHPECGYESFLVELDEDGDVWFTLRAVSRSATWYAQAAAPLVRIVQRVVTDRYVRALVPAGSRRGDPP